MSSKIIHHHIHGKDTHDLAIYLTERMIVQSGGKLLDGSWYAKRNTYPGIPDVYCRVKEWRKCGASKIAWFKDYVIEIESNLTEANRKKKESQFQQSNAGTTELIIVNLADQLVKCYATRETITNPVYDLETFIGKHLPFVED